MPPIPEFDRQGVLPPGIYRTTLSECLRRFAAGSPKREQLGGLLRAVVDAARQYETVKRVLVWGNFVTTKAEPNDLDYSIVVSVQHQETVIRPEHRRFLVAYDARLYYGVDRGYLRVPDYPLARYIELVSFLCTTRNGDECGIVEIPFCGDLE